MGGAVHGDFKSPLRFRRPARKHVLYQLKAHHQSMKALQQVVVQIAGNPCSFRYPFFQAHVELMCDLLKAKLVQPSEQN